MNNKEVRVRFAPSPTGYLHVGGARTALFNYLFAKSQGGKFILRIEDTDRNRFQEEALNEIYSSLEWLGLNPDESPLKQGEYGPYVQSERKDIYTKYIEQLLKEEKAYRCFCTSQRLEQVREEQEKVKENRIIGYDRHCRSLSKDEEKKLMEAGTPYVVRLKVPLDGEVTFKDAIRGYITTQCALLDDLILMKSDGFPTYHLANVVDDHLMEISHVMRGDEWIATTPRHIVLYDAFKWTPPTFAHLPVILSPSGGKLSKRKGAASVMDYKERGYLSEALLNFLALLGWNPGDDREIMDIKELCEEFSLEKVNAKPSVFDEVKLEWMNGQYLSSYDSKRLLKIVKPFWEKTNWFDNSAKESYLLKILDLMKIRSKRIDDLVEPLIYFFETPNDYEKKAAKKRFKPGTENILDNIKQKIIELENFDEESLEELIINYAKEKELSNGKIIHPLRLAASGVSVGPGLFDLLILIGKEELIKRIDNAVLWIKNNKVEEKND